MDERFGESGAFSRGTARAPSRRHYGHHLEQRSHLLRPGEALDGGADRLAAGFVEGRAEPAGPFQQPHREEEVALGDRPENAGPGGARGPGEGAEIDMRRQIRTTGSAKGSAKAWAFTAWKVSPKAVSAWP